MIWQAKMWKGYKADYSRKWFEILKGGLIADKTTGQVVDKLKG
jgi:hypothetical protein